MSSPFEGPSVELTVKVRYPLPEIEPGYAEFGIHSAADLVADQIQAMELDPSFLADLVASDRSEVSYEFDVDGDDDPFGGDDL